MQKQKAFTLAEVLITLGIIGIVAAMTLPVLTAKYKKNITVTRLQKFYSTINQAVKLSEVSNGKFVYWDSVGYLDGETMYSWWNKYMDKYFTGKDVKKLSDGVWVTVADGSGFAFYNPCHYDSATCHHVIFCVDYKSCKNRMDINGGRVHGTALDGKNTFLFIMNSNIGVIPYSINDSNYDVDKPPLNIRDDLMNGGAYGCAKTRKTYCAALIQYDGWKIKDDYPIKF